MQLPAAVEAGTGVNTQLLIIAGLGIALLVVLIAKFKFHPFLALILGSGFVGLAAGVEPAKVIANFEDGVGGVLKEVGLLVALGAMLGKLLADSGGANQVVDTLLAKATGNKLVWSITLVAVIIGLPMFFEIGLVLLLPVIVLVTQRSKMPLMRIAIPALAGLSVLHGLVPPHPGPLIAISALKAELGTTLALGILVAIPTVIICGPLFSRLAARWVPVGAPAVAGGVDTVHGADLEGVKRPPSFLVTLLTILFPVVLMLLKAVVDIIWPDPRTAPAIRMFFDFVGQPLVAMTLAVLLAMVTFGYAVGLNGALITKKISASLGPIAGILLIVGAGGGFKQTLIGAGVGDSVKAWAEGTNMSVLVLGLHRGRCPAPGNRLRHGRDRDGRRHRGAAGQFAVADARRTAGPRDRRRLAVLLARERRRVLARQGAVWTHGGPDVQDLVRHGNADLRGELRPGHAALARHLAAQTGCGQHAAPNAGSRPGLCSFYGRSQGPGGFSCEYGCCSCRLLGPAGSQVAVWTARRPGVPRRRSAGLATRIRLRVPR